MLPFRASVGSRGNKGDSTVNTEIKITVTSEKDPFQKMEKKEGFKSSLVSGRLYAISKMLGATILRDPRSLMDAHLQIESSVTLPCDVQSEVKKAQCRLKTILATAIKMYNAGPKDKAL